MNDDGMNVAEGLAPDRIATRSKERSCDPTHGCHQTRTRVVILRVAELKQGVIVMPICSRTTGVVIMPSTNVRVAAERFVPKVDCVETWLVCMVAGMVGVQMG